jgi:hypothetical protein
MQVDPYGHQKGAGWVLFAWIMLAFAGVMNVVYGITALANSRFFTEEAVFVFADLRTWGWITLIFGIAELLAAASVWRGGELGRWVGIVIAGLNAVSHLGTMQAYPFWSIVVIAFDVLVIYALAVYGGRRNET